MAPAERPLPGRRRRLTALLGAAAATAALLPPGAAPAAPQAPLTEVVDFGSNPGNLRMYLYIPAALREPAPLVVALHGCGQRASDYDDETGWAKYADRWGFALLLPEQRRSNNALACFNWFNGRRFLDLFSWSEWGTDQDRDEGEALSIRQMIDRVRAEHAIDPGRIFVSGLSGGGGMAAVMLAAYPELFAGGAIIAGIPYKCATGSREAVVACGVSLAPSYPVPIKDLTPSEWGRRVRDATGHRGRWPRVSVWQGDADRTVDPDNARELLEQWTEVHGIDRDPDLDERLGPHRRRVYEDSRGTALVETYTLAGAGHGTPVDPGPAEEQCGSPGRFRIPGTLCSSYHIARFWGLAPPR
jgi:poly(hydroxyalkanoate) depolymerase family esterase